MPDIIQLLPDRIANQIAAGEVVQNPSNAVKELLENAIDAQATVVKLIVKEGGKSLIQVIDDGCGMSITDARMCFERHATSKLRQTEDLQFLRTMGFRGEAMAAIAAVAQVELKTNTSAEEIGTLVSVEGGDFQKQEPIATPKGTSIAVKNLLYNIPARRGFLRSNSTEYQHILAEFNKIALAHPEVVFQLYNEGVEVLNYTKANLKQRVVQVLGKHTLTNLVPVEERSNIINLTGFVAKPSLAKKRTGDQYFFVNQRFIKDSYFHHAVKSAFDDLLSVGKIPIYVLFLELDPAKVDVNRHPSKTEAKFIDDREIYAILKSAVKRALGYFNVMPTLDFDSRTPFDEEMNPNYKGELRPPSIEINPAFNPFAPKETSFSKNHYPPKASVMSKNWGSLYEVTQMSNAAQTILPLEENEKKENSDYQDNNNKYIQIHQQYILTQIRTGVLLIQQKAAHEKILYHKYMKSLSEAKVVSQQNLFPQTISFDVLSFEILQSIRQEIKYLGFELSPFGKYDFTIEAYPAEIESTQQVEILQQLISDYKNTAQNLQLESHSILAKSLAKSASINTKTKLSQEEMKALLEDLFACENPNFGINGHKIIHTLKLEELSKFFDK